MSLMEEYERLFQSSSLTAEDKLKMVSKIIRQYGASGIDFLLKREFQFSYFERVLNISDHENESPWQGGGFDIASMISSIFVGVSDELSPFLTEFSARCLGVFPIEIEGEWYLLYPIVEEEEGDQHINFWMGGAPVDLSSGFIDVAGQTWKIPRSLSRFYKVHDGFGPFSGDEAIWWDNYILPFDRLTTLKESLFLLSKAEMADLDYDPDDLLEFFPDGSGNGQYFFRAYPEEEDPPTRDWDHESRALGPAIPFFEFLNINFLALFKRE